MAGRTRGGRAADDNEKTPELAAAEETATGRDAGDGGGTPSYEAGADPATATGTQTPVVPAAVSGAAGAPDVPVASLRSGAAPTDAPSRPVADPRASGGAPAQPAAGGTVALRSAASPDAGELTVDQIIADASGATVVTIKDNVYEEFRYPGSNRVGHRLLFHKGQVVPKAQLDRIRAATEAARAAREAETG